MATFLPARTAPRRDNTLRIHACAITVIGAWSLLVGSLTASAAPLTEVAVLGFSAATHRVHTQLTEGQRVQPGTRVLLLHGAQPLAWGRLAQVEDGKADFTVPATAEIPEPPTGVRAWLVGPDVVADLLNAWPAEAALQVTVDSMGPGAGTAWLRAGQNQGIRVGHTFWLRHFGQALARCDVRYVSADLSHATVVPLVAGLRLKAGDVVALWPAPQQRHRGAATSAASFVESQGSRVLVWIAAPRGVDAPAESHVDYFRDGRYFGHGLVERQDERFWYATFNAAPPPTPASQPTTEQTTTTSAPASQPTTMSAPVPRSVRVGDDVEIRTQADIDARRFVARVFEQSSAGPLVNAGEADGLAPEQEATLYRDGALVGRVRIRSTQRTYAVIEALPRPEQEAPEIRLGDELRFVPPREAPVVLGTVEVVKEATLIVARLSDADVPLGRPLALRLSGRVVGVAVIVGTDGGRGVGCVLPCAALAPAAEGMELVAP